jgi:hypothetical protein
MIVVEDRCVRSMFGKGCRMFTCDKRECETSM